MHDGSRRRKPWGSTKGSPRALYRTSIPTRLLAHPTSGRHSKETADQDDAESPRTYRVLGSAPFDVGPLGGECSSASSLPCSWDRCPLNCLLLQSACSTENSTKVRPMSATKSTSTTTKKNPVKKGESSAPKPARKGESSAWSAVKTGRVPNTPRAGENSRELRLLSTVP